MNIETARCTRCDRPVILGYSAATGRGIVLDPTIAPVGYRVVPSGAATVAREQWDIHQCAGRGRPINVVLAVWAGRLSVHPCTDYATDRVVELIGHRWVWPAGELHRVHNRLESSAGLQVAVRPPAGERA